MSLKCVNSDITIKTAELKHKLYKRLDILSNGVMVRVGIKGRVKGQEFGMWRSHLAPEKTPRVEAHTRGRILIVVSKLLYLKISTKFCTIQNSK